MKSEKEKSPLIAGGHGRARSANIDQVTDEVKQRYAPALASAGFLKRLLLRWRMRKEIAKRMQQLAPDDALYFKCS